MVQRNKCVVVGGSGALGSSIAQHLLHNGYRVAIVGGSRMNNLKRIEDSLSPELIGSVHSFRCDFLKSTELEDVLSNCVNVLDGIDVLIHCAGVSRSSVSWKTPLEEWELTQSINLTSVFRAAKAVLAPMRSQQYGRMLFVSSIVGSIGVPGTSAYSSSKAGIEGFTRALASEVAGKGVTANSLALGYFDSGIIDQVPEEMLAKLKASIPIGRLGTTSEFCSFVRFLISQECSYLTGQTLHLNGGLLMS